MAWSAHVLLVVPHLCYSYWCTYILYLATEKSSCKLPIPSTIPLSEPCLDQWRVEGMTMTNLRVLLGCR